MVLKTCSSFIDRHTVFGNNARRLGKHRNQQAKLPHSTLIVLSVQEGDQTSGSSLAQVAKRLGLTSILPPRVPFCQTLGASRRRWLIFGVGRGQPKKAMLSDSSDREPAGDRSRLSVLFQFCRQCWILWRVHLICLFLLLLRGLMVPTCCWWISCFHEPVRQLV